MTSTKLRPSDSRVEHCDATVRGKNYHYLHGKPKGQHKATILLCHGFPDLSFGWRAQIPMLIDLGLQVIAPDLLGYGRTAAPKEVEAYSFKNVSADLAELVAKIVPGEQIILGGHDWGGALVWRFVDWHPELVRAIVCLTPHGPPRKEFLELETVIKLLPNFAYQKQFAGPEPGREITTPQKMHGFLNAIMGGKGPNGEVGLTITEGAVFENLEIIQRSPLLNEEEAAFYVSEFMRNGIDPPLNWYRTRRINYDDELALFDADGKPPRVKAPTCFIAAGNDVAIPVSMSDGMGANFDDLEKHVVPGTHWVLFQSADDVNKHIKDFLVKQLDLNVAKASI